MNNQLPNIQATWGNLKGGECLKNYHDWIIDYQAETNATFATEQCARFLYLREMIKAVGGTPIINETTDLRDELMLAFLKIKILSDWSLADKLIEGQRLKLNLHDEYVKKTHCYG